MTGAFPHVAGMEYLATVMMPVAAPAATPQNLRNVGGIVARPALDPTDAVLIVIDAQEEYRSGKLPLTGLKTAVAEIARLRNWAHRQDVPVIHVRQLGSPNAAVFAEGTKGADFLADLAPAAGEKILLKRLPNAFAGTQFDALLAVMGRHQLIVTGFMTHMCVDATSRAAFDRGFTVFVVASATADRDIPDPDGAVVPAETLRHVALAALNDRFAWVVGSVDMLIEGETTLRKEAI